ncbi:30S ribosomal protein S17, partial [Leptospira ellisii]
MTAGKQHINKSLLTEGRVVSDSMDKTVVILVETRKTHPRFKKIVRKS